MTLSTYPQIFQLEVTSVCNLRCTMCPYSMITRPKQHISWELLHKVRMYTIPGDKLGLHVMGEPLLHPDIVAIVAFFSGAGILPELATNGTIMSESLANSLIDVGLHEIWFSFDAGSKELYESIRVGATFERVVKNVKMFLDINIARGSPVQAVVQKVGPTTDDADDFLKLWEGYDARVKFMDSWAGTMNLDKIEKPPEVRTPCAEPWNRVAVLVNGDVVPCCRDWEPKYVYGNLNEMNLYHIWRSARARALRYDMQYGVYSIEPCASCNEWNIEMDRNVVEV